MNWTIIIIETIILTAAFTAMILIPLPVFTQFISVKLLEHGRNEHCYQIIG